MKISFIDSDNDSRRLILLFPGWSCGRELYDDFCFKGWDVAVVEDYADFHLDTSPLEGYSTVYLFAWSLGVFMAEISGIAPKVTGAFALNGTLSPADDSLGIPRDIYVKTAENLTPRNLQKFRRRMAGDSTTYRETFDRDFSEEESEGLKGILLNILDVQDSISLTSLPWSKVFISENDAIFPFINMMRHWERMAESLNCEIIPLQEGHYVPLERIVRYCIPQIEKVSRRFSRAASTYDSRAVAQRELAAMLRRHLCEGGVRPEGKILEVGPGTGIFTREIIEAFRPSEIDFVDISDMRPYPQGIPSEFHQRDAEEWIVECRKRYDAILSSSTVQWFVNLPLFIKNCADHLNEGGILGFSTFLPGNLDELTALRPSPIHYHTSEEIREWMEPWFEEISFEPRTITLHFDSARELFSHLRETGVGGSAPEGKLPLSALRNLTTLTFRCGCFAGRVRDKG